MAGPSDLQDEGRAKLWQGQVTNMMRPELSGQQDEGRAK